MKKWLTENKIFFEIGSTILFGAASIFLAFAANSVSQNQLEIAKIQLEPHIFISEKYLRDEAGVATESFIEVTNAGAPIHGFSVDTKTFYTVTTNSESIWIPVVGYYYATFELDAVIGKLAEVRGRNNNSTFAEVYLQQLSSDHDTKLGYAELGRTTIVRVRYETRQKEIVEEYFVDERRSDESWAKEMFRLQSDHLSMEITELDWPEILEASLKIKDDAPFYVREGGF